MPTLSYRRLYFLESGSTISYMMAYIRVADSLFFCSCHGCIKDSSYFQNLPSLFSPFLTSFGRVMELRPDLSGSRAFSMEVSVFVEKHTASAQVRYDVLGQSLPRLHVSS